MTSTTRGTSTDYVADWRTDGMCSDRAEEFDLDIIRDDIEAIRGALAACHICPVLKQCIAFTRRLAADDMPPLELVQAGHVWTTSRPVRRRIDGINVTEGQIRAGHNRFIKRKAAGLDISDELRAAESTYQAWRKRERRKAAKKVTA